MGLLGRVLVLFGLGMGASGLGTTSQEFVPNCTAEFQTTALVAWLGTHSADAVRVVDRKRQPIWGEIKWLDNGLWLFAEWSEPLPLVGGNPLRLDAGVLFAEGRFTLTRAEIVGP